MPQKEVDLLGEICMMIAMQAGHGYELKTPETVAAKAELKAVPYTIWLSCGAMIKSRIEEYCRKWYLPFDKWLLFLKAEGTRRHLHPGEYTQGGTLRKTIEAIAKNKADVLRTIEMIKATGTSSVSELIEILIDEVS